MIKVYVRAIMAHKKTVKDVPEYWREQVKAEFDAMLADGKITQEEYDEYLGNE